MTFTATALSDGKVGSLRAAIYTVPAVTILYLKSVTLFNTHNAQVIVSLWLNRSSTSRMWRRFVLEANESATALDHGESIILEAGDIVEAQATVDIVVDYTASGVLETNEPV